MYLVLESRYKAFYQVPSSFFFKFVFTFSLRVFNFVQFPVLSKYSALFLQGTYLEAVSGLHCFIFRAHLIMEAQVIIINCCHINL